MTSAQVVKECHFEMPQLDKYIYIYTQNNVQNSMWCRRCAGISEGVDEGFGRSVDCKDLFFETP